MAELEKPTDDLTGLSLRKDLHSFLEELLRDAAQNKKAFTLILFDIDHFKKFNDKLGHPFGDEVLKYTAGTLHLSSEKEACRVFRYGGDEFIIVLPGKTSKEALQFMAHYKYIMRHRPFVFGRRLIKITTSSGIAAFPSDAKTMDGLIEKADQAMYFSKRHGHNFTTLAGRIKLLKFLERTFFVLLACILLMNLFMVRDFISQVVIPAAKETVEAFGASLTLINYDKIILKDGTVLTGRIKKETYEELVVAMYTKGGAITTVSLKKTEIGRVRYGLLTLSREKYREYVRRHPSPHSKY